jgi:hypothetical protein
MKNYTFPLMLIAFSSGCVKSETVLIHNDDYKTHVVNIKCDETSKNLVVRRYSTYTFSSGNDICRVVGGTVRFSNLIINNGEVWNFKDNVAQRN